MVSVEGDKEVVSVAQRAGRRVQSITKLELEGSATKVGAESLQRQYTSETNEMTS